MPIRPMIAKSRIGLERMPHFMGEYAPHISVETGWVGRHATFVDIDGVDVICHIWEGEIVFARGVVDPP